MGYDGKCSYTYKCKQCGEEYGTYATLGRDIDETHAQCRAMVCDCGSRYVLSESEFQGYDGCGTWKKDIPNYFNGECADYYDALRANEHHEKVSVRERVARELREHFPNGRPK